MQAPQKSQIASENGVESRRPLHAHSISTVIGFLNHDSSIIPLMAAEHGWTFLSNHGHVLVAIARDPHARVRDLAERVGITERAAQQIVGELVNQGIVVRQKVGRRNSYTIAPGAHLRHPLEAAVTVADFAELLTSSATRLADRRQGRHA